MDHRDFFQSIIESPDDDAPRLVYADWLDEHGDSDRAEFIRVQCSLAQMPANDRRRKKLERREKELLSQYGWIWAEDFSPHVNEWVFRRGFIERVQMSLEGPPDAVLSVLEKAPIRHIRDISQFCDLEGIVTLLPHFDRLTGLELWYLYAFDNALLAKILASPHLANLRTLILHHDRNGNLAAEDVLVKAMGSSYRSNLEELAVNVDGMWRGPSRKILKAIASSPYLRKLRKLDLTNAGDEGNHPDMDLSTARILGNSPNLAGLQELDMGQTSFSLKTWDEVLKWPFLSRLKWLRLHYARQVNPPDTGTVAQIQDLPAYRGAFEQSVAVIDWETEFINPWTGNTCWRGLSWEGREQQHLFSMWPYIQRGDSDALEAAFRADCSKYVGENAAKRISELPFDRYEQSLQTGLKRAVTASGRHSDATSIYLRIRPDLDWNGEYHVSNESILEPFAPHKSYSHNHPLAQFQAPSFPEAARVRNEYSNRAPLDPGGVRHYLLAHGSRIRSLRCPNQIASPDFLRLHVCGVSNVAERTEAMPESVYQIGVTDPMALQLAQALAEANRVAIAEGMDPPQNRITIEEEPHSDGTAWRVHYGFHDVMVRGGDLSVTVDKASGAIRKVIHGQ